MYRSEVAQSFGVSGVSHVVGYKKFKYTPDVNLTVVEIELSTEYAAVGAFCWIDQAVALQTAEKIPIDEVCEFVRDEVLCGTSRLSI